MDEAEINEFGRVFRDFIEHVVNRARLDPEGSLVARLETFLGADPANLPVVTEEFRSFEHATVQIAVERLLAAPGVEHELIGVGGPGRAHHSFSEMIETARQHGVYRVGAVDYTSVPVSVDEERACVRLGLYLISEGDNRLVVMVRGASDQFQQPAMLEVLARTTADAREWLAKLRDERAACNTLRGQVLSFSPSQFSPGAGPVTFIRRPDLGRSEVIMPDGVLERLERQVVGVAEHRERLLAEGHHLKRGVLLYGPPGTGKTHTVRYLTGSLRDFTVILLAGPSIAYVAEACALARTLQPALIVLEDCDLIAEDRSFSPVAQPLLFTILDEMDGLASDSDVCFLLTTNRVEALETALTQRPGRVDLAVEIPLPDRDERRRLVELYAAGIELDETEIDVVVERTAGVPASFMKELARRATLTAAGRGEWTTGADVMTAMEELMASQETLTRRLLGEATPVDDGAEEIDPEAAESASWFAYAPGTGSRFQG